MYTHYERNNTQLDKFTIKPLPQPYDYYTRGHIYISKRDNRRMIVLYKSGSDRTLMTYARFLVQIDRYARGLPLVPQGYEIDHKDDNKLNDRYDNLDILTKLENVAKQNALRGFRKLVLTCPMCAKLFTALPERYCQAGKYKILCCSAVCRFNFFYCRIPVAVRDFIVHNQPVYSISEFYKYGDRYPYIGINAMFKSKLRHITINDMFSVQGLDLTGLYVSSQDKRYSEINTGLQSNKSIRQIARDIGISHPEVVRFIQRYMNN